MKVPENVSERIESMDLEELYNWFIMLEGEYKDWEKDHRLIRYGINISFLISQLWKESRLLREYEDGKVWVAGTYITDDEFELEKIKRRKIMQGAILSNLEEGGTIEPR